MITLEEYKKNYNEEDTPSWSAIDTQLAEIYKNQEPRHYAALLKYMLGGKV